MIASEVPELVSYNQSPVIAIPATKKAPRRIISRTITVLTANQRNPLIRCTQKAASASESQPRHSQT